MDCEQEKKMKCVRWDRFINSRGMAMHGRAVLGWLVTPSTYQKLISF